MYVPFWLLLTDGIKSTPLVCDKTLFAGPFQVIAGAGLATTTVQVKLAFLPSLTVTEDGTLISGFTEIKHRSLGIMLTTRSRRFATNNQTLL